MVMLKILGAIDFISAFVLLLIIFGDHPYIQILVFCAGLLMLKGMFIFTGDVLSILDIFSAIVIFLSIFFTLPATILWIPSLMLLAKAMVSFA